MGALPAWTSVQYVMQHPQRPEVGVRSPWSCSYRGLQVVMWMLGIEPGSSARAAGALIP